MFSEALAVVLEAKKMSQKELGAAAGIDKTVLTRYLTGERMPGYNQVLSIADALKIDPGLLFPSAKYHIARNDTEGSMVVKPTGFGVVYSVFTDHKHRVSLYRVVITEMVCLEIKKILGRCEALRV